MPSFETIMWLAIAALNAFTAWATLRTRSDMRKVEIATNSMKDALVAATRSAAHADGREEARLEGEQKAAAVAQGKLQK